MNKTLAGCLVTAVCLAGAPKLGAQSAIESRHTVEIGGRTTGQNVPNPNLAFLAPLFFSKFSASVPRGIPLLGEQEDPNDLDVGHQNLLADPVGEGLHRLRRDRQWD